MLIAKLADDIAEEAVSASVGQARLYGMAAGGVFLALQKGREVKLRSGDVIEVEFGRAGDLVAGEVLHGCRNPLRLGPPDVGSRQHSRQQRIL